MKQLIKHAPEAKAQYLLVIEELIGELYEQIEELTEEHTEVSKMSPDTYTTNYLN